LKRYLRLHGRKEGTEFAVGELFGGADGFFNPPVNRQFLLICVFEDFKPLIFRRLFIGGHPNIAVDHIMCVPSHSLLSSARYPTHGRALSPCCGDSHRPFYHLVQQNPFKVLV
jgi:hypothetical protein